MLDNYFTTLRAHSKIEFVALASSEERCERVKQRWGEACRVFHLGEYRWTKQLIGREILAMLRESRRPVVLVDTDMSVGLDPEPLLAKLWCDFGVDFAGGDEAKWNINTGFLFFAMVVTPLLIYLFSLVAAETFICASVFMDHI